MKLSRIGRLLAQEAPIVRLMEDLGEALNDKPDSLFLGGGNPQDVPEASAIFANHLQQLAALSPYRQLGVYQSPLGNLDIRQSVAQYLQKQCDWPVTADHIALVSGSQSAFFILFNLFCGDGLKALLPLVPEYLGYAAQAVSDNAFVANAPLVTFTGERRFKYQVDFNAIALAGEVNLMCLSSPANPSGNVLLADEMARLADMASRAGIPLVLDYAYGRPFPGLIYRDQSPFWQPGCVSVLSLSKLGLPGARAGVIVADPELIQWVARANTNISLAGGNLGANLLQSLLVSGDIHQLSGRILPDFYRAQRDQLVALLDRHLAPFDYAIHEPEGAFFIWLWLKALPISSHELYIKLKARGVIVMPGEHFFFGVEDPLAQSKSCLRLSYCQPADVLAEAVVRLARELRALGA